MSKLNNEIRQRIDSFDIEGARALLRQAVSDANAETYYLASLVALDTKQAQRFLEKCLTLDPKHNDARHKLRELSPSEKPQATSPKVTRNSPTQAEYTLTKTSCVWIESAIVSTNGEMTITNQRIKFEEKFLGMRGKGRLEIPFKSIASVLPFIAWLGMPDGVKITLKSGKEYKFRMYNREAIINLIDKELLRYG
ncbi:MAG: hypothetical protein SF123_15905 [Chloroflexota bacterium]|nr:hypothetical protein [Chloroflexota bacterium]